jgi:ABC-type uncharacterized transport system permease subunit
MACVGAAAALSTRAVLLGRALFYLLVLLILSMFWDTVAAENQTTLPPGLVLYVGVAEWIALSIPAIHLRLEDDIRSGAIEAWLLRPLPYLLARVSEAIGAMTIRLAILGCGGAMALLLSSREAPSTVLIPLLILLGVLGGVVNILLVAIVGLSAFWMRRTLAAYLIVQKLTFLLGGLFAPVTLYPAWLAHMAKLSPFAACLYWPSVIVLGVDGSAVLTAFAAVLAWIAALSLLCGLIWHAGMRRRLRRGI